MAMGTQEDHRHRCVGHSMNSHTQVSTERKPLLYGHKDETTHGVPQMLVCRAPPVPLSSVAETGITFLV